jgi:hypothetical protein
MTTRLALPARRNHVTQKVKVTGQRILYLSLHDDAHPAEIFLRLKGSDCSSELIGLYDVIARLMSQALQYGASLEKVGELLTGAQFPPCGPMSRHDRIKHLSSLPDRIVRNELIKYCDRDLAHMPRSGRKRPRMTLSNA